MPDRQHYDVVIVGARCAGAATALLLARRGVRVLLVDRSRRGSDTLSTHALMRPAVVQLHRWGLLDEVAAAGTPAVTRVVFHYGDESVGISLRPVAGTEALYAPRRTVLDPVLLDAAERAGADVLTGVRVRDLHRTRTGVVGGVVLDAARTVEADLVVGADGARSLVAAGVGAPVERSGRHAGSLVYGYFTHLPADGYEWFYGSGVTAGLIPTNDDSTLAFVTRAATSAGHPVPPGLDGMRSVLRAAWPEGLRRLDAAKPVSSLRRYRGTPFFRRRPWGDGWALVGDAGLFVDPMSSHGISQALRDAELLADALTATGTRSAALAGYQRERDGLSDGMLDVVERLASFRWTLPEVQDLLMALTSHMSDEVSAAVAFGDPWAAPQAA